MTESPLVPAQDLLLHRRESQPAWVAQVRSYLEAAEPVDAQEKSSIAEMLVELDRLHLPAAEDGDRVHVTGSAFIVGPRGIVMHFHKRAKQWFQPGGHVGTGETPWAGALREGFEETGIPAHHPSAGPLLLHVDVHEAPKGHRHLDLRYLLLGDDVDPAPPEGESQQVRWCTIDEARALSENSAGLAGALTAVENYLKTT